MEMEMSESWTLLVLDHQGVELFKQKGATPSKRFAVSTSTEEHLKRIGDTDAELLGAIVKGWGLWLASSSELKAYSEKRQKAE
jgi:hypothetical protein